jgi:hypothetical protein
MNILEQRAGSATIANRMPVANWAICAAGGERRRKTFCENHCPAEAYACGRAKFAQIVQNETRLRLANSSDLSCQVNRSADQEAIF